MTKYKPLENLFHKSSYSARDAYCKYQGICEYYTYSCRLGEITPYDCPYTGKVVRAKRIEMKKGRRI